MDEKTEELRELFLAVADEETVTEHQHPGRGSLETDRDVEGELAAVIAEMRDRYDLETDLDDDQLITLVEAFYEGWTDEDLADLLEVDRREVRRARLDLHLVRAEERDAPFDVTRAVRAVVDGATAGELAERFDVEEGTVRRFLRVHDVDRRSRLANQRFRDAFDTILGEAELSTRMVREVHRDGLEDATDGLETNVSF